MKKILMLTLLSACLLAFPRPGHTEPATQVDSLVKKLIEKGILTKEEAEQIKGEIVYDEKTLREANNKKDIPQWAQDLKLKGDFRLRHELVKRNDSTDIERERGRIRYRLGLETKVNDQVKLGVGIASNGGGPRSTNQSFSDTFSKSTVVLDYAYAQYDPNEKISIIGGKMKIPFWEPGDLLWDTDLTPEGASVNLKYKINDKVSLFSSLNGFVLDEITADASDPFMYVTQGGIEGKIGEKADYKLAATWYGFDNGKEQLLDSRSSPTTNSTSGSKYVYSYSSIGTGAEIGLNDPFGESLPLYIGRLAAIGEFIHNPDPKDNNNGWLAGMYLGNPKVNGKGQWKITGTYRSLGKDAWLDALPDSDFYGGATDVRGYEGILEIGLMKNVVLAVDYYRSERISAAKAPESVLQTDLNFKF